MGKVVNIVGIYSLFMERVKIFYGTFQFILAAITMLPLITQNVIRRQEKTETIKSKRDRRRVYVIDKNRKNTDAKKIF